MKTIVVFTVSLSVLSFGFSQSDVNKLKTQSFNDRDTLDGRKAIKYSADGLKLFEATYKPMNSVPCIDCYELISGEWHQYSRPKSSNKLLIMGEMINYHPNGVISSIGQVGGVREYIGEDCENVKSTERSSTYCDGLLIQSPVNHGAWKHYNEDGELIKEEEFLFGMLVHVKKIK